jgi:hypothetical protein
LDWSGCHVPGVPLNKKYIKKLDFELSSLKLDVFMYVEVKECVGGRNPKDASECVSKLTLDAVWKFGGSSGNIDPVSSVYVYACPTPLPFSAAAGQWLLQQQLQH